MNALATLLTTYQSIPNADRENPIRRQELLSVLQSVIGKQDDLVSVGVNLMFGSTTLQFILYFKPHWLDGTEYEARIDFYVEKKEYRVRGVIVDNADTLLSEWGDTEREDSGFNLKKFPNCATPIYSTLLLLKHMYKSRFNATLKNTDSDLAHAVEVSALIKPHIDAIKELCAKNCVNLWIDTNINSTQPLFVLPESANIDTDIHQPLAEIKEDKVPTFDLALHAFNSYYDHFVYPEKNKEL
jgi:hypothetical protein